ncbi:transposase (plasmid) [Polymorphobacter sp. PAMC 29334]|uniref:transposase n=1 Tax=Polymorphobacter sp. PAMC 29334 TaxID=2862331 RepID=UPI001C671FC3|nr:transposase [Polymorphobacter sp. PAMC 29334]QYE33183.1 transposase [Polymorphobacter sp. PAMC 29334]
MAGFEQRSKRYSTELTDEKWQFIQPFLPLASKCGRKSTTYLREVLDALRYLARTGGGCRILHKEFPPWQTAYRWFRRFERRLLFRTLHDVTLMLNREREGREHSPRASSKLTDSLGIPKSFAF